MAPINGAIWALNKLISAANKIPFVSIPSIPSITIDAIPGFADGVNNFSGGLAMVNEKGPEGIRQGGKAGIIAGGPQVANLKKGTDIVPNNKLGSGGVSAEDLKGAFAAALKEVQGDSKIIIETPVELKIGDRTFDRKVISIVVDNVFADPRSGKLGPRSARLKPGRS